MSIPMSTRHDSGVGVPEFDETNGNSTNSDHKVVDVDNGDPYSTLDVHGNGESPWTNISTEVDAMMIKSIKEGGLDCKNDMVKMFSVDESGNQTPTPFADRHMCNIRELFDMNGNQMGFDKRFCLCEAGRSDFRALDYESNKRQIVFKPKNNDGLHLVFDSRWSSKVGTPHFAIRYPGGSSPLGTDYLLGMLADSHDVVLGKNQASSMWMFEPAGKDSLGHHQYAVWTWISSPNDYDGFWMPDYSVARAGYDKDHEWKTYGIYSSGPPHGYFYVKFQAFDQLDTSTLLPDEMLELSKDTGNDLDFVEKL